MIMQKIREFMYGRYGTDKLSLALIIAGFVCYTLYVFSRFRLLYLISLIFYGIALFRTLSKNINARRIENQKYLRFRERWHSRFRLLKNRFREGKTHVFRRCKQCKATLRLPRKRGRHTVKCPCCQQRFRVTILFGASDKARKNDYKNHIAAKKRK